MYNNVHTENTISDLLLASRKKIANFVKVHHTQVMNAVLNTVLPRLAFSGGPAGELYLSAAWAARAPDFCFFLRNLFL